MTEKIIIYDFGSQYTQLIARVVRELNVYCEILPFNRQPQSEEGIKGIILSGSPFSVNQHEAPFIDIIALQKQYPVLGVCYGAQLMAKISGGEVAKSNKREYGRATLEIAADSPLFTGIPASSQVWMSHSDTIQKLPEGFSVLATTESIPIAAFSNEGTSHPQYGLQFHPEVYHSTQGKQILQNFLSNICGCTGNWTPSHYISETVESLRHQIGDKKVVMGLSGGVDSTVAATLIHKAIGNNLFGIFVDNGLLRKNEFDSVLSSYHQLGLNVKGVNARNHFYTKLAGKTLPEEKRKAIGTAFIDIFDEEAHKLSEIDFLGQGTIYPDVIESVSVHGPSVTIKSHHNVGGLPDKMKLKLVEPLRSLFKDEVRRIGAELNIPANMLGAPSFPRARIGHPHPRRSHRRKGTIIAGGRSYFYFLLKNSRIV